MEIIADKTETAIINCATDKIDLTEWLFGLKEHEYQACSSAHIAAGATVSADGKRMSVNVEMVADNLLVQHYVEEISERDHCKVNSISDSFSSTGRTKLGVTWEVKVRVLSDHSSEFSNRVIVSFTDEFLAMLENAGVTDLEQVKFGMAMNVEAHNKEETPLFAKDIESKALAGTWG